MAVPRDLVYSAGAFGVVWSCSGAGAIVFPVCPPASEHQHRADVTVDDADELRALGAGSGELVIRVGHPMVANSQRFMSPGRCTDGLWFRICLALRREIEARRYENSMKFHKNSERCVRL